MATRRSAHGGADREAREASPGVAAGLTPEHLARGAALARGSLFTRTRARANASDEARAACETRQRRTGARVVHRTHLYERERFARAEAETAAYAAASAFVVQYEESGVDAPVSRLLGVFSSEASARAAVRMLDRARSLVTRASISAWPLDAIHPRSSVEIDPGT